MSDEDIAYAGEVLLGKADGFSDDKKERAAFIKNLETIDLQAVPGSGKTTVLLAKLLILERYLPFEDGSGILVISHTNTAVDQIGNKIGKQCPKLFAYPNFVGTIQGFVDRFLAIPYYAQRFQKRPYRIDDQIYREEAEKLYTTNLRDFSRQEQKDAKYYVRLKRIASTYRFDIEDNNLVILDKLNGRVVDFTKPEGRTRPENYRDFSPKEKDRIKKWLIKFREGIWVDRGILHFDDAYFLAKCYLRRYPIIKTLLQRRFRYVFVDEMQDMDTHQYDLLDQLFYDDGNSRSIYQRIGDRNQAIFSGGEKYKDVWKDRDQVLCLTGSQRLSPSIVKVVEPFGMPRVPIQAINAANSDIPPRVIVFDDNSVDKVIPQFCDWVKTYKEDGRIPPEHKYPVKAIAWRKGNDGKFGLQSYWADFDAQSAKSRIDYPNLKGYLLFAKGEGPEAHGLNHIQKSILNGLLRVLRVEGVVRPQKTSYFTVRTLHKHLRENQEEFYEEFIEKMFYWSSGVYEGKTEAVYGDIEMFIPRLLGIFGKKLGRAAEFVKGEASAETCGSAGAAEKRKAKDNVFRCKVTEIKVQVGTVHSVKGETHTATLYLESYYKQDGRGELAKSYESQRLKDQFDQRAIGARAGDRTRQSARMVYVGFSRPTHLLCFALHSKRFDEDIFTRNGWKIHRVC
jgi:hypothetical protein